MPRLPISRRLAQRKRRRRKETLGDHITFFPSAPIKIKGSFSASGGLEYNYTTPFRSMQQLYSWDKWTKSGLIGVTKTVSMKSRLFKKTKVQLLWDFLSYQQVPRTKPVLFRIGYGLN